MAAARPGTRLHVDAVIRDPGISHGRFRPLQRTDMKWIVYDPELPPGRRSVAGKTFADLKSAEAYARALALQEPKP